MCGEHILPEDFKPLPFVSRHDDPDKYDSWAIDEHGDIIDIIDRKIESYINEHPYQRYLVSDIARIASCSNGDARMTLERLTKNGVLQRFPHGPQGRWLAYRRVDVYGE